jgi:hypothetical protein
MSEIKNKRVPQICTTVSNETISKIKELRDLTELPQNVLLKIAIDKLYDSYIKTGKLKI